MLILLWKKWCSVSVYDVCTRLSACFYFVSTSSSHVTIPNDMYKPIKYLQQEYAWKEKLVDDDTRKYSDKFREVSALADRMGCSFGQLAIAWSLKNESVQCLLLGAANIDQLYESLQSLQVRLIDYLSYQWNMQTLIPSNDL